MSYTLGGTTGDDITVAAATVAGADNNHQLMCGWWYPTTLTAGKGYGSFGNLTGMYIDSTTSQLRFKTDNTTDGEWTAPGGITTNTWWFIAWLSATENTGPATGHRCWVGDAMNPPAEITVTQAVAPVGNFTGNSNRTAGNIGTGTVAFQGDIGWVYFGNTNTQSIMSPWNVGTSGSIAQSEADYCLQKWLIPLWLGRPPTDVGWSGDGTAATINMVYMPMDGSRVVYRRTHDGAATSLVVEATVNGATYSANECPRRPPATWMQQNIRCRA